MQSRMDKYYGRSNVDEEMDLVQETDELEKTTTLSRLDRNKKLYQEVSNKELEDFNINSNASVIGRGNEINIDSIREMLDKKYRELPKNKSMGMSEPEIGRVNLDETREYDINSVLEKATAEKEENYEDDRLRKLRNTQYDILKSLDVFKEKEKEEEQELEEIEDAAKKVKISKHEEEEKLQELINTITMKELSSEDEDKDKEFDSLDLLSDLRGDDENTRVMGIVNDETAEDDEDTLERTLVDKALLEEHDTQGIEIDDEDRKDTKLELKPIEIADEDIETKVNEILEHRKLVKEEDDTQEFDKTDTNTFNTSDFDDFDDLKDDMKVTRVILRVLIFVIIVAFVIGCIVLANKIFGLGLF